MVTALAALAVALTAYASARRAERHALKLRGHRRPRSPGELEADRMVREAPAEERRMINGYEPEDPPPNGSSAMPD